MYREAVVLTNVPRKRHIQWVEGTGVSDISDKKGESHYTLGAKMSKNWPAPLKLSNQFIDEFQQRVTRSNVAAVRTDTINAGALWIR